MKPFLIAVAMWLVVGAIIVYFTDDPEVTIQKMQEQL